MSALHDPHNSDGLAHGGYDSGKSPDIQHVSDELDDLLDFYFGHPSSTKKNDSGPRFSKW